MHHDKMCLILNGPTTNAQGTTTTEIQGNDFAHFSPSENEDIPNN